MERKDTASGKAFPPLKEEGQVVTGHDVATVDGNASEEIAQVDGSAQSAPKASQVRA